MKILLSASLLLFFSIFSSNLFAQGITPLLPEEELRQRKDLIEIYEEQKQSYEVKGEVALKVKINLLLIARAKNLRNFEEVFKDTDLKERLTVVEKKAISAFQEMGMEALPYLVTELLETNITLLESQISLEYLSFNSRLALQARSEEFSVAIHEALKSIGKETLPTLTGMRDAAKEKDLSLFYQELDVIKKEVEEASSSTQPSKGPSTQPSPES